MIFQCKSNEEGETLNPPVEEIMSPFQKWMDEVEFRSRVQEFETVDFLLLDEETVYALSTYRIESEE